MAITVEVTRVREALSVAAKWRALTPIVTRTERQLSRAFAVQGRQYRKATKVLEAYRWLGTAGLREAYTPDDWLTLFDTVSKETKTLFFTAIQTGSAQAMELAATQLIAQLGAGVAFNLTNPRAVAYLREHGYGLIADIDAVTRGNIQTIVDEGISEGWSYDRVADEITDLYREMAVGKPQEHIKSRAHLIAVTELGQAYEAGNSIVVDDLAAGGLVMQKKWSTVHDERVSAGCWANEEEDWIPKDQPHASGHAHPLRFPGCRCAELYRRKPGGGGA